MTEKIKILLADDHAILRVGLASVFNTYKDIHVIGDAENGDEAISKTLKLKPDVVIMGAERGFGEMTGLTGENGWGIMRS